MEPTQIDALAHQAGALPEALPDIRARILARFGEEPPEPPVVERWLVQTLKPAAPHLFSGPQPLWTQLGLSKAEFDQMPPAWRKGQADQHTPAVTRPHPNRPVPRDAPADVQEGWKDLSLSERVTAYRAWVAAQQPQG
jgi:hypothetical protein